MMPKTLGAPPPGLRCPPATSAPGTGVRCRSVLTLGGIGPSPVRVLRVPRKGASRAPGGDQQPAAPGPNPELGDAQTCSRSEFASQPLSSRRSPRFSEGPPRDTATCPGLASS
ncbi:unnamed protein product [Rangifer tarandus platyrhynchus]|uniref:Uncharacterized protein n=2 Tax=Rangifer tarandus platyrhynchus TaxID=3082113 RepID=A0ABN8YUT2_RANTA|nr:unnamed protein product [Rangifer tarandus platyrhynchus]CAI9702365.1 unnamed protein product [Rangifer tarandus platyrhynchus]